MHAKINNDANELKSSNFDQLEHYIHDTLDSGESLRLKLESPLSVGAVLAKYVPVAQHRWWFPILTTSGIDMVNHRIVPGSFPLLT